MAVRILLADDEAEFRFGLSLALSRRGYRVEEAGSGDDALKKLLLADQHNDPFKLLITDVRMPAMSGIELFLELRRRDMAIPVLAISGVAYGDHDGETLRRMGFAGFLSKPLSPNAVFESVEAVLPNADKPH